MRYSTLHEWLSWQETAHTTKIDLGLSRCSRVADMLNIRQPRSMVSAAGRTPTVITVAGTNGKGSCVAALEALLLSQGLTVGAYTSPHLHVYNERIRLNGKYASDDDICAAFEAIDSARDDTSLSYFEFGTLAALYLFKQHTVDVWLLEVGLGGRLDAVNIVDTDIAVITSIALDHEAWLGNDREVIGREKAGICRAHRPLIVGDPEPPASIRAHAASLQCMTYYLGDDFGQCPSDVPLAVSASDAQDIFLSHGDRSEQNRLTEASHRRLKIDCREFSLPIPSVLSALQVCSLLDRLPSDDALAAVLSSLKLPGRYEKAVLQGRQVRLDVGHNPAAVSLLVERLRQEFGDRQVILVFAIMVDKDIDTVIERLSPVVKHWCLASLDHIERAANPHKLQEAISMLRYNDASASCHASVADALQSLLVAPSPDDQLAEDDIVVVTGSFFTVSAAREFMGC